ncbi:Amino acid ABC transporter, fused permease and periplasmic binding protein [Verrucomicrobia bacterium]|nr:Amino acid ABC transporter, fused permease and periplasmic binding protein [Verrucomicrobiota bacterium]
MSDAWRCSRATWLPLVFLLAGGREFPLQAQDHLQSIRASGVLRWGADAEGGAPYVYPDPQQPERLIGFECDLADALAAKLGVKAKMVQNEWDQLIPALERGNFDIILNGLEITPENQQHISMSLPYYVYAQQIVTRKGTEHLVSLTELKGRRVGVLSGSVAQRLIEGEGGADLRIYPGNVEALRDLKAERLDAALLDLPIAIHYARPDPALKFSGTAFAPGYYGIGARKQDITLLAALNQAIGELSQEQVLERIYRKYGLWDERQAALEDYRPAAVAAQKPISTLHEWPRYLPLLLRGAVVTVELSVLGMALAVVAGLVVVLVRLYAGAPLSGLAQAYVEVMRGTPLLIQLFLIYYGLPEIGIRLNPFFAGILGLGLNYAASEAENYRAGIQSIPRGQTEAALALGMGRWQTLRHVVLPQALRVVIPPVTNDFIAMFKDSSIVSVITMVELTKVYGMLAMSTYDYIGLGLMTAGIYFALSYPASIFAGRLEKKLSYDHR